MKRCAIRWSAVFAAGVCVNGAVLAQDLTRRAKPQEKPVLIVNAVVHPVDGPVLGGDGKDRSTRAWVAFDKGVITGVGGGAGGEGAAAAGVEVIDAMGMHVYPGLVSGYTQLGLTEIQSVRASEDQREIGQIKPEVYAAVSVNPDSWLIPVARTNGVLVAGVFPTGGLICGRAGVIRLEGWTWEEMAVERDIGMAVAWPVMRPVRARWMDRGEEDQSRDIRRSVEGIEGAFREAKAYIAARDTDKATPIDIRWEAMRGVLPSGGEKGGSPARRVYIEATDYDQIVSAVSFAAREGLRCTIIGGRDAPMCAGLLKEHGVGVVVNGTFRFPKRDDSAYDEAFTLPARLEAAGIRWCLAGGDDTAHERNLPYNAAMAVAYGLDREAGVRGITLSAAELLGVGDRLGSLTKGKEATLLIADGDILEVPTQVTRAFIQGKQIDLSNKQTELEKKYRDRQ